jgi:large subunit ribosomal protein L32
MAVPKKRRSKSRKRTHRSMWTIAIPTMVTCKNCNTLRVAHRTCMACGYFKNAPVVQIKQKVSKNEEG